MNPIILAIIVVTVIGLVGAVILVAASIFMYVPVDERVEKITGRKLTFYEGDLLDKAFLTEVFAKEKPEVTPVRQ